MRILSFKVIIIIISFLVVFAIFSLGVLLFNQAGEHGFLTSIVTSQDDSYSASLIKERERWSKRIDEIGAEQTYQEFKAETVQLIPGKQHTLAHLFGELLYENMDIEGVAICDQSFDFGCYHSFFGTAVEASGLEVLPLFDEACQERWGGAYLPCQHGIGHGILVFVKGENLLDALDLCGTLSWQPIGGCSSGVFMEYNFRTMETALSGKSYVRLIGEEGDAHAPCSSLPSRLQPSCYFEMSQWWEKLYGGDYEKIGMLCSEIEDARLKKVCFQGAGNYAAPFAQFDVRGIRELCDTMPGEGKVFCREGASWILLGKGEPKEKVRELCAGLPSSLKQACQKNL